MKTRRQWALKPVPTLSMRQRCILLGVNRSHLFYTPRAPDNHDVTLMNEIQEIYGKRSFQGYKRMTQDLKDGGHVVNHKRVYGLMKIMGLQAVYPKKNLSKRRYQDAVFPYLLKDNPPSRPHDVWCTDITYIKTAKGFVYVTGLIDVVSRYVVGWHVSPFLDTEGCLKALEMAINSGFKPVILNSDQGCQFTSQEWVFSLALLGVKISMDGKGRCLDNIPIERFWRTLKYEEVYLKTYETVTEAKEAIAEYIHWYNHKRRHSGINNHRPYEVMIGLQHATYWPFAKEDKEADKRRQHGKHVMNLSSQIAA